MTVALCALALSVLALNTLEHFRVAKLAWACALVLWALRFVFSPRPRLYRSPVYYALAAFFLLTLLSSLLSYDREASLGKLQFELFFTVVFVVAENVSTRRARRLLTLCLIGGCLFNVGATIRERIAGRGVKIIGLKTESPLFIAGLRDGDTLLAVDDRPLNNPDELYQALAANTSTAQPARIVFYRFEWSYAYQVPRGQLLGGATQLEQLGIGSWRRGRDWRELGFHGDYTVYAEILQFIGCLTLGLLVALKRKLSWQGALLALSFAGFCFALLLTIVRASWLAFLVSILVIVLLGASRRTLIAVTLGMLLVVPAALFFLQQKRNVGFYDRRDGSITWRETVYREGVGLLFSQPRHLLVGVGTDSVERHHDKWGLFDNGRLPPSHLHSTPLAFAVERGLPALVVWLALLFFYGRLLFYLLRSGRLADWFERGITLGAMGGLVGFFLSGIVNYNLGHWQVAIIFYLIMGLTIAIERETREHTAEAVSLAPEARADSFAQSHVSHI